MDCPRHKEDICCWHMTDIFFFDSLGLLMCGLNSEKQIILSAAVTRQKAVSILCLRTGCSLSCRPRNALEGGPGWPRPGHEAMANGSEGFGAGLAWALSKSDGFGGQAGPGPVDKSEGVAGPGWPSPVDKGLGGRAGPGPANRSVVNLV